jgi:hypothetical protein
VGWNQGSKGGRGIPNRRPSPAKRWDIIGFSMNWDASAEEGRQKYTLWGGSRDQGSHRRGQNVPSARGGSRSPEAKKKGWFSWLCSARETPLPDLASSAAFWETTRRSRRPGTLIRATEVPGNSGTTVAVPVLLPGGMARVRRKPGVAAGLAGRLRARLTASAHHPDRNDRDDRKEVAMRDVNWT